MIVYVCTYRIPDDPLIENVEEGFLSQEAALALAQRVGGIVTTREIVAEVVEEVANGDGPESV